MKETARLSAIADLQNCFFTFQPRMTRKIMKTTKPGSCYLQVCVMSKRPLKSKQREREKEQRKMMLDKVTFCLKKCIRGATHTRLQFNRLMFFGLIFGKKRQKNSSDIKMITSRPPAPAPYWMKRVPIKENRDSRWGVSTNN